MTTLPPLKIAIIGAGPSGLVLARLLHISQSTARNQNIHFTIFESEPSPNARTQGGCLDLRTATGLAAIHACSLYPEFLKHARFDGEALNITDKDLKSWFQTGGREGKDLEKNQKGARPEIDRVRLREILLGSVPEEYLQWGKKLKSATPDRVLVFEDGTEESGFDLIVGADGCWSKTRLYLSQEKPVYAGVSGVELCISDVERRFPELWALVNKGSLYAFGNGKAIMAQMIGDGSIKVGEWGARPEAWVKEHDVGKMGVGEVKRMLMGEYEGWTKELKAFIECANEDGMVGRALYMLPVGYLWESKRGVTVIGDAAHVMVPFAGEGANLSMADAMHLASWILKSNNKEELEGNVREFEKEMWKRMKQGQQASWDNMRDMFFTEGAPGTVIERYLTRMVTLMAGNTAGTLAGVGIYAYYGLTRLLRFGGFGV